jgi:hypothetical protein
MASDANTPASLAASLAGPLRVAGWVCWGVAAAFFAAIVAIAITEEEAAPLAVLFAPAVPLAIGIALRYAARVLETGSGPELPTVAAWAFGLFGAPLLAGGILGAWDALARIALILMGAGFLGAGWLAHRLFATPRGMKAVAVSSYQRQVTTADGRPARRASGVRIFVAEDAGEDEIQRQRQRWLNQEWQRRPDWVSGRIEDENARGAGKLVWGAALWSLFALSFLAIAMLADDSLWWWVTAGGSAVALGLVGTLVRERAHRRMYPPSHFVMDRTPARPGEHLRGVIETGVRPGGPAPAGFLLKLECVQRWEERVGGPSGNDRGARWRRDVLWSTTERAMGRPMAAPDRLAVGVDLQLPADLPETTLGSGNEGVRWELHVHAPMPGLDYRARFVVPVLGELTTR